MTGATVHLVSTPPDPGEQSLAAMVPDRGVGDVQALAQLERLCEVARGYANVVPVRMQTLDHRAHDEHVRAVCEVDPDAHRQAR